MSCLHGPAAGSGAVELQYTPVTSAVARRRRPRGYVALLRRDGNCRCQLAAEMGAPGRGGDGMGPPRSLIRVLARQ